MLGVALLAAPGENLQLEKQDLLGSLGGLEPGVSEGGVGSEVWVCYPARQDVGLRRKVEKTETRMWEPQNSGSLEQSHQDPGNPTPSHFGGSVGAIWR